MNKLRERHVLYRGKLVSVPIHEKSNWMFHESTALFKAFADGALWLVEPCIKGLVDGSAELEVKMGTATRSGAASLVVFPINTDPWFELRDDGAFTIAEPGGDDPFYLGKLVPETGEFDFCVLRNILEKLRNCEVVPMSCDGRCEIGLRVVGQARGSPWFDLTQSGTLEICNMR